MSTRLQERSEKIQQILEKIAAASAKNHLIIVEGQKDLRALRELNIKGKIITAKTSRKSLLALTTEIEKQTCAEVILLLDFDRRGKELTKRLMQRLEAARIKTNTVYWRELKAFMRHDVKDIESIPTYLKTLNKKLV
ncbi:MAG: toprim domain-containing protein [Candidatus Bathyarchaeales archaeon]